jgi:hypothetical protein
MNMLFSNAMVSNLYTMTCTAQVRPNLALPSVPYTAPSEEVRFLRARLILEEATEAISGLGFQFYIVGGKPVFTSLPDYIQNDWDTAVEQVIDGCVDTIYVCTGTLAAYGVPDRPHIIEVNRANDSKFPNGVATLNDYGKFQKPPGWVGPDHARIRDSVTNSVSKCDLNFIGQMEVLQRTGRVNP